jgi:putative transposase
MPEWSKEVPYQIKSVAIRDCCQAVSNAKRKFKQTGKFNEVKFRSKKRGDNNLFIPQSAVSENGVYHTILGKLKTAELLWKPKHDCRFVFQNGRYFVIVPIDVAVKRPDNQRLSACSLDCGVRTFQTVFSKELIIKVGEHDFQRIFRYCYNLDKLISRKKKEKSNKFNKAMQRIRWKVRDLIDEIHNKLAVVLCRMFDVIYIPTFETHDMVSKLRHKTSRAMLGWAHYRFKQKLKSKAEEYSCRVIDCTEEYSSKTCGECGEISSIGGKEVWTCKHCGCVHDRDINGARNILLKQLFLALRDSSTPCLV